ACSGAFRVAGGNAHQANPQVDEPDHTDSVYNVAPESDYDMADVQRRRAAQRRRKEVPEEPLADRLERLHRDLPARTLRRYFAMFVLMAPFFLELILRPDWPLAFKIVLAAACGAVAGILFERDREFRPLAIASGVLAATPCAYLVHYVFDGRPANFVP